MTNDQASVDAPTTPTRRRVLAGAAAVGVVGSLGALAACSEDGNTSDVPVGGGQVVVLDNAKVVVTQPTEGEFLAFSAICTHAGCTVQGVSDGEIACPCHGSRYDATTGEVVVAANNGDPGSQAPLAPVDIAVQGDTVSFA
jgi:Rieske Fe-S protein